MKTKSIVWKCTFALLCSVGVGAYAQAAPTATESDSENPAELTIYSSNANAVMVTVLNLTPFDMEYKPEASTLGDQLNRDRTTKKSFAFAPVGIPGTICGTGKYPVKHADGTVDSPFNPATHTMPECLERLQDVTTPAIAPVPFMIAWDDNDGLVENTSLVWTVHDVICNADPVYMVPASDCVLTEDFDHTFSHYKSDIDLGLWFNRSETEKPRVGELFRYSVAVVVHAAELLEAPENPYGWKAMYMALMELTEAHSDFEEWNLGDYTGAEMMVSSYPIPHEGSYCSDHSCIPEIHEDEGENDNVTVHWATSYTEGAGIAEGSVIVMTQVLRGHNAHNNIYYDSDNIMHSSFSYGSLTSVYVTILPPELWTTASIESKALTTSSVQLRQVLLSNGFGRIRQYLLRHGREGALALLDVVGSLPPTDLQLLMQATKSTLTGQLRKEEEEVLRTVAKALDKHP